VAVPTLSWAASPNRNRGRGCPMVLPVVVVANPGKPAVGDVWGVALGQHGDVVNSFQGQ
jgi:hypothetical protein